jgi:hypothetical protein
MKKITASWTRLLIMFVAGGFFYGGAAKAESPSKNKETLYNGQGKRDPFIPLITPSGYLVNLETDKNASLHLEGIMFDPKGDSIAIINGELVRAGESIGDAVCVSIEPTKITVLQNNQKIDIELRREG